MRDYGYGGMAGGPPPRWFWWLLLVAGITSLAWLLTAGTAEAAERGDSGAEVIEIQTDLRAVGYTVKVDGVFGPQTVRAVRHFQRANRLQVDGVVGPITERALAKATATRGAQVQISPPPPPPEVAYTGRCAEWAGLLHFFNPGWDVAQFQNIMYRESRCQPDVTSTTGCCHGLLQIHQLHIPNLGVCGVRAVADLFDPGKNICSAAVMFRRAGGASPWNL